MLVLSIILLIAGAVLVCIEMHAPGVAVPGITGAVLIVASMVITAVVVPFGFMIVIGEAVVLLALGYGLFQYLKKHQLYGKLILDETLNQDTPDVGDLSYFLDKEGVTKTVLRPSGDVDFNGTAIEVFSESGYVPEGRRVKVVSVAGRKVSVKEVGGN